MPLKSLKFIGYQKRTPFHFVGIGGWMGWFVNGAYNLIISYQDNFFLKRKKEEEEEASLRTVKYKKHCEEATNAE